MTDNNEDKPLKILLVDDEELNQRMMEIVLTRDKHVVQLASNGAEALEAVKTQDFDFILMDLNMPGMDGMETSRQIRACERGKKNTYIIALTASYMPGKTTELFDAGIDNYIAKPFEIDHLRKMLKYGLDNRTPNIKVELTQELPVLDTGLGMEMVGGDEDTYKDLLFGFLSRFPERLDLIVKSRDEKDAQGLVRAMHSLKGITGSLGVLSLSQTAENLEMLARENAASLSESLYQEFLGTAHQAQEEITKYLGEDYRSSLEFDF